MSERRWRGAALFALTLAFATPARASWTPAPGHGFAKLWVRWLAGVRYLHGERGPQELPAYHELALAAYGDLGLVDALALGWQLDVVRVATLVDPDRPDAEGTGRHAHVSPGDPSLSLRWRFFQTERAALGLRADLRVPLAPRGSRQTLYTPASSEPIGALRMGGGDVALGGRFTFGYAFDRWYLAGSLGYRWRSRSFDDQLLWTAVAGMSFSERWGGTLRLSGAHSLPTGDAPADESPSGLGNGASSAGLTVELDYELRDRWFIGLALEGPIFLARRQAAGPALSAFVSTQY